MASFQQTFYDSPMVDTKTAFPSPDGMLDDSLLGMISPNMSPRRGTFSQEGSVHFEGDSEAWAEASHDAAGMHSQLPVQMPASLDQTQAHVQNMGLAHQQWATPAPTMFGGSPQYEWHQPESVAYAGASTDPLNSMVMQHRPSFPMTSVESEPREWSSACQVMPEHGLQSPRFNKHNVPYGRAAPSMRFRGDGIRKKNARFEIPAEVNLQTVDKLINQASDDRVIKELKQQKRLLRNRQAALDSRLRKKQHTEKLEGEMKRASMTIQQIQGELERVKRLEEAQRNENALLNRRNAEMQCHIEELKAQHRREIEELKKFAQPTAELNYNNVGSTWSGFASDETLHIVSNDMQNDFSRIETPSLSPASSPSFSSVEAVAPCKETDSPFSWEVFCMCLLLGAIVASRSEGLVQNTMFGLSQNYNKEAKRLLGSIVPASVTPSGQMVRSVGDSKLGLYMPMDDQVDFNNVNRDTLQHVFDALKYTMPKGKTTISEQTVKDFKTLLNAAPASTAATSVPL